MVEILISENDSYYSKGLMILMRNLFGSKLGMEVKFLTEFNEYNISQADVIITEMRQGEQYICSKNMIHRKKGILIGIVDSPTVRDRMLPSCIRDITFIDRSCSLQDISNRVMIAWGKRASLAQACCENCSHKSLSYQQTEVLKRIYHGYSPSQVADELRLSEKTVYSHKYILMKKFNLQSSYDLYHFLELIQIKFYSDVEHAVPH